MGNLDKLTKSLKRRCIDRLRPLKRKQSDAMSPKSEMLRDIEDSHLTAVRKRIRYLGRELQNIQSDYPRLWFVTRRKSSVKDNPLSKHLFGNYNILLNSVDSRAYDLKKNNRPRYRVLQDTQSLQTILRFPGLADCSQDTHMPTRNKKSSSLA